MKTSTYLIAAILSAASLSARAGQTASNPKSIATAQISQPACIDQVNDALMRKDSAMKEAYETGKAVTLAPRFLTPVLAGLSAPFFYHRIKSNQREHKQELLKSREALEALAKLQDGQEVTSPALQELVLDVQSRVDLDTDEIVKRLQMLSATNKLCDSGLELYDFSEATVNSYKHAKTSH